MNGDGGPYLTCELCESGPITGSSGSLDYRQPQINKLGINPSILAFFTSIRMLG